jgi:hypothetical protein
MLLIPIKNVKEANDYMPLLEKAVANFRKRAKDSVFKNTLVIEGGGTSMIFSLICGWLQSCEFACRMVVLL